MIVPRGSFERRIGGGLWHSGEDLRSSPGTRGPKRSASGLMKAGWDRHDAVAIAQLNLPLR